MAHASNALQAKVIPPVIRGEKISALAVTEPTGGSDVAALQCKAVRDGDHYVVTGQKVWTSHAHEADWMYTLVRTSTEGRKQEGITLLLIPLDLPGIRIQPIRTIDAWQSGGVKGILLGPLRFDTRLSDKATLTDLRALGAITSGDSHRVVAFAPNPTVYRQIGRAHV